MNTCAPCHCSTQQYGSLLVEDLAPTYVQQVAYLQHCHLVRIPFIIYQKQEVSPRSSHIVVGYHYQNTQCSTGIRTYCYVCGWRLFCIIQDILQTGLEAYKQRTHSPNGTQSHTYISQYPCTFSAPRIAQVRSEKYSRTNPESWRTRRLMNAELSILRRCQGNVRILPRYRRATSGYQNPKIWNSIPIISVIQQGMKHIVLLFLDERQIKEDIHLTSQKS